MATSERQPFPQPEKPLSLAELSRRYLQGEIGIDDYLAQERQLTPRFGESRTTPDAASIASHVAGVVENLQKDQQTINNSFELCRRADNAMVAMLEVVSPALPENVREQVNQLLSIHDTLYKKLYGITDFQEATPSAEQHMQEHEH